MTIHELRNRAENLTPTRIKKDLQNFIKAIKEELIAYNVATLHEKSKDTNNKPIGVYSYATEIITKGRKKQGEPYNLLESGKFLNSIFVKIGSENIFFSNNDPKRRKVLAHLWSDDIFGLREEDLDKVIKTKLIPYFRNYFLKNLFK